MSALLKSPLQKSRPATIGAVIDNLWSLREQKRAFEDEIKILEARIHDSEAMLLERMDAEGLEKSTGSKASVGIGKTIKANIDDWDIFTKYIKKTGYFHLLQRRVSDPAARELFEQKGMVPGLSTFTARKINLRSLSGTT